MMYFGQSAINFLINEINHTIDFAASSHWREYHAAFHFTGDGFKGLQGFGGCKKSYRGLDLKFHSLLQYKFRRLGAAFPQFKIIDALARKITASQGRAYDLDVLRQAITLAFLKEHVSNLLLPNRMVCVIGDGFASMTSLLLASSFSESIILVNLTKTLLVDLWYLKVFMGSSFEKSVCLVTNRKELETALKCSDSSNGRVIAIMAVNHDLLQYCSVNLAINIASMQEMNPADIKGYFDDLRVIALRQEVYFYCCNREEKRLPDGTITRFSEYPWQSEDEIFIDEPCPWHQQYYNYKLPFYHPYDGIHRHRLVKLQSC